MLLLVSTHGSLKTICDAKLSISCQNSGFYLRMGKGVFSGFSLKPSPLPELKLFMEDLDVKLVFQKYHLLPNIGSVEITLFSRRLLSCLLDMK